MKTLLMSAAITCGLATSALAGEIDSPAIPTAPVIPAATDWSGFYLGASASFNSGSFEYYVNDVFDAAFDMSGDMYGGFAGYNIQRDALVFGAEVAYSSGETVATYDVLSQDLAETTIDAKARVGYAFGDILLYGVAGGTLATVENSRTSVELNGMNYGAGVQMKFGNGMFVGAEYLIRDLSGVNPDREGVTYEYNIQSVALRAGWQF